MRAVGLPGAPEGWRSGRGAGLHRTQQVPVADPAAIRALGATVVRVPIAWPAIEPGAGWLDPAALARACTEVEWAGHAGLFVVLDMHQFAWATCHGGTGLPPGPRTRAPGRRSSPAGSQPRPKTRSGRAPLQRQFADAWTAVARAAAGARRGPGGWR